MSGAMMLQVAAMSALLSATSAAAARAPAQRELEQKAYYWVHHGREDKAAEVWRKLLRSDPEHAHALAELVMAELAAGNVGLARAHLGSLERAHPEDDRLASLRAAVEVGARFPEALGEARRLGHAGHRERAVAAYARAFGGAEPTTCIALEYFQTLAGLREGWRPALRSLRALAARYPGAQHLSLAVATHLTYRERTRREGITSLAALARVPGLQHQARRAWRQALLWLEGDEADLPLLRRYVRAHPDDAELRRHADQLERRATARRALSAGFAALEAGELGEAEQHFLAAERAGGPPEALVGLATVALRREDYARARELLQEVQRQAPGRPELWQRSLQSAELWLLIEESRRLEQRGDFAAAERALLRAIELSAGEFHHAELALADLRLRQGDAAGAETILRRALASGPGHAEVTRALVDLLLELGRGEEAMELNEQLRSLDPDRAHAPETLRAAALRGRARQHREAGELVEAQRLLRAAAVTDPSNHWAMLELVTVELELAQVEEARRGVNELLARRPDLVEAQLAAARVCESEGDYEAGLQIVQALAPDRRTPESERLFTRLRVLAAAQAALRRFAGGDADAAGRELELLEREVAPDPELVGLVALAWAEAGRQEHARSLLSEAVSRAPASVTLRLQLAAVLMRVGDDTALVALLRELEAERNLRPQERRGLRDLRIARVVHQADLLREDGDIERAVAQLQPMLSEYPGNADVEGGLGRILYSAGEYTEAEATFARLLALQPGNTEALYWATMAALARRDTRRAEHLVQRGLAIVADDARMHLLAGRLAVMRNDRVAALEAFSRARVLAAGSTGGGRAGFPAAPPTRGGSSLAGVLAVAGTRRDANASLHAEIERELAALQARTGVTMAAEVALRNRGGEAGLQALTELAMPATLRVPLRLGTLAFTATPILLDAGELSLDGRQQEAFGSAGLSGSGSMVETSFRAAALSLGFAAEALSVDVGSTPLGFTHATMVGGARWRRSFGRFGLSVDASRRAVTDSVLSYAGLQDPGTGKSWGSVVSQGGRVDVGYTDRAFTGYAFGGYRYLTGVRVPGNQSIDGGFGVRWRLYDWRAHSLTTGGGLAAMGYQKNLSAHTFGHGGYFSPRAFVHAGVPVSWAGRRGSFEWAASAEPGINWFHVDRADLFPTRPDLQAAWTARAETGALATGATYPGRSSTGFAFNGELALSYRLVAGLDAGCRAGLHTGEDYVEMTAAVLVTYSFSRRLGDGALSYPAPPGR